MPPAQERVYTESSLKNRLFSEIGRKYSKRFWPFTLHYFLLCIIAVPAAEGEGDRLAGLGEVGLELGAGDRGVVVAQREVVPECVSVRHGGVPPFVLFSVGFSLSVVY